MKKILWLCSWYPHPGNPFEGDFIQRHAMAVARFMHIDVIFVNQDGAGKVSAESRQVVTNESNLREHLASFGFHPTGIRLLDKVRYHFSYFRCYRRLIRDYVLKEGKPDLIHVHIPLKAGQAAGWIKKQWGIPYVVSEHSSHYQAGTEDDFFDKTVFHRRRVRKVFREAICVTNVSEIIALRLKNLFSLDRVRVIPNTVDTRFFHDQGAGISPFRFIHVSTLSEYQKNISGMVRAISALYKMRQDFEFVMVGPASDELKKKVLGASLQEVVHFTGEISYPEVAEEVKKSSAFILFSRYENFPCVIIEALCCGVPVISTDTGGVKEAINESNGLLIDSEKEDQLVEAMNRIMDDYGKYNRPLIAREAASRYSYEAIGKAFADLYQELW